ncbi:hypothetical protein CJU89_3554 [Yarrowia sp. B02]|nr:hypothetical protein CJU89_3554 [Yarrowia sp. B02]
MLASPFEPQASFAPSSRDSWRSSLSSDLGREYRGLVETADYTFRPAECSETLPRRRSRLMPAVRVQPLRVNKIRPKKPAAQPTSAWSDSDDSESDYEAHSICDSDTDVEGCQSLPKYAGMPLPDSPKSQSSEFTVQALKTQPKPRARNLNPMLSPSETVMERYAPLEWSEAAREALKSALDKRQRAMEDAGVSHFIQIEALHNTLKDVAFGVSLRESV